MNSKWSWIFGILTAAAFVFGLVFFLVTQQLTNRDWAVLGIGALVGATAAALVATFIFHSEARGRAFEAEQSRLDLIAAADAALVEKRTALIEALPTRRERLDGVEEQVAQLRMSIVKADGNYNAGMAQAVDAANHGFQDMVYENQSAANTWKIAKTRFEGQLRDATADRDRLAGMTDEAYLAEQKSLRGLD